MADWYYIGHYGQLGPLTREQVEELVGGGVIARETFVWKAGMVDWIPADRHPELSALFVVPTSYNTPPPSPAPPSAPVSPGSYAPPTQNYSAPTFGGFPATTQHGAYPEQLQMRQTQLYSAARSDRSRALAGVLQLIFPGIGRIYLGYSAIGVLQLVSSLCFFGYIWSIIDGIIILTGGVRIDGFGRPMGD